MLPILLFFLFALVLSTATKLNPCPGNLVWSNCASACPATCQEPNPVCIAECKAQCTCPPNFPIEIIPGQLCGTINNCEASNSTCNGNLVWNRCASACPVTCADPFPLCIANCVEGCSCPSDSPILLEQGKLCGTVEDCSLTCPGNLIWQDCATDCTPTCENPNVTCSTCNPGCGCPPDLPVMLIPNQLCGSFSQCINSTTSCSKNQVWSDCACARTCDNLHPDCSNCKSGCSCQENEILNPFGKCVHMKYCSRSCSDFNKKHACHKVSKLFSCAWNLSSQVCEHI